MADFKLSANQAGYPPNLPLQGDDLIFISQLRGGVWATAVISLAQLVEFVQGAVELNASQITSGTLPIANGGTNATTEAAARSNLEVPGLNGGNAFTGDQSVTGVVSATGGFDDTSA